MSNAIGSSRESNPSQRICHLCAVLLCHAADLNFADNASLLAIEKVGYVILLKNWLKKNLTELLIVSDIDDCSPQPWYVCISLLWLIHAHVVN